MATPGARGANINSGDTGGEGEQSLQKLATKTASTATHTMGTATSCNYPLEEECKVTRTREVLLYCELR